MGLPVWITFWSTTWWEGAPALVRTSQLTSHAEVLTDNSLSRLCQYKEINGIYFPPLWDNSLLQGYPSPPHPYIPNLPLPSSISSCIPHSSLVSICFPGWRDTLLRLNCPNCFSKRNTTPEIPGEGSIADHLTRSWARWQRLPSKCNKRPA